MNERSTLGTSTWILEEAWQSSSVVLPLPLRSSTSGVLPLSEPENMQETGLVG